MTQVVYGRTRPAFTGARVWMNARYFTKPVSGAVSVFLDGDFPAIRTAYEAKGVRVVDGLPDPLDHDGDTVKGGSVVRKSRRARKSRA